MLLVGITAFASEKITFEVKAPMIISVGEAFRVEFVLNAKPDKGTFSAPDFNGFDILAGPATSQGSSVQFINGNMNGAISFMDRSIELSKYNKATYADALYWKGEALFQKGDYNNAANSYRMSIINGGANSQRALYGIGYTLFQQKRYPEARKEFKNFIDNSIGEYKEIIADAFNRIADCHFYQRNFEDAAGYYAQAANTFNKNADYSLYRYAQIQSLKDNHTESQNTLKRLISKFPDSPHTEQALYEMGRSYIKQEKHREAINTYDRLIATFPGSATSRRAMTERAMIYNSMGDRRNAIEAYKDIIAKYPQSEEALVAMQDLKSIYVEMGKVDQYAEYIKNTAGMQPVESSEIDTLTYIAAEKAYGRGELNEAKKAFEDYLQNFPAGAFSKTLCGSSRRGGQKNL